MSMIKCRAICPWSKTATVFADDWRKLCNKMQGHPGMHKSANGALWSAEAFSEPPGIFSQVGYSAQMRVHL